MEEHQQEPATPVREERGSKTKIFLPVLLFLVTVVTTTISGILWQNKIDLLLFERGITFSVSILFILSCHEFGHFFAARHHKIRTTLPYYIPLLPLPGMGIGFGTMGAVIRIKEPFRSRRALFDVGVAGPIAGFVASLIVLAWGFTHLPGREFLLDIHHDYDFALGASRSAPAGESLAFGSTLLYTFLGRVLPHPGAYVPPMTEMYHYPFLITGWFGLFVTAMNMLPVGQLDGGHVAYAMFGERQGIVAKITTSLVLLSGLMGMLPIVGFIPGLEGMAHGFFSRFPWWNSIFWSGWLIWAILIFTVFRINHPYVPDQEPLSPGRMVIGWLAFLIFLLSITPAPFLFI